MINTMSLPEIEPQVLVHPAPPPLTFSLDCYTDLSSASKAVVKNAWGFSCIPPYVVMTKVVIKQKDSFIFYI